MLSYRSTFLVSVHPSFFKKKDLQSASTTMSGTMERVNDIVISGQKRLSECAHNASQMRRRELEKKKTWLVWIVVEKTE